MEDIYRSQFRMPYGLYEKLKAEADKAGRSVNAELVARLEQSLNAGSNDADLAMVFDILGRMAKRNPDLRYSFSIANGGDGPVDVEIPDYLVERNPKPPRANAAPGSSRDLAGSEVVRTPAPGRRTPPKPKS